MKRSRLWLVLVVLSIAIVIGTFVNANGWRHRRTLKQDLAALQEANRDLKRQIKVIERKLDAFSNDPEYQKLIIRRELGYVGPNEMVFESQE